MGAPLSFNIQHQSPSYADSGGVSVNVVPYSSGPVNARAFAPRSNGGFGLSQSMPPSSLGSMSPEGIGMLAFNEQAPRPAGPDYRTTSDFNAELRATPVDFLSFGKTEEGITNTQLLLVVGAIGALAFLFGMSRGVR